ncbi:MAG: rhodanese-like domain-containing protein [Pseudomonadota bacterium]|nr:rhodanese-like domain-containing protein [Pseudomonadota bacterium]
MFTRPNKYLLIVLYFFFFYTPLAFAEAKLPGPLVNAEWLAENLNNVVVLDARKQVEDFAKEGHISSAVLVNVKKVRVTRTIDGVELTRMIPAAEPFAKFMSDHGVSNNSTVIITHRGETAGHVAGAARLYWQLRYYGFDSVALLDGGNKSWVESLEELVTDVVPVVKGTFSTGTKRSEILATTTDVELAMKKSDVTLIDTRPMRYHIGRDKRDYVFAYGHIPGSRNFNYKFLNPEKGIAVYSPVNKVEKAFKAMHIDPSAPAILYCNSAFECSSVWFFMTELMGNKNVSIYDGSLHEWTMKESHPMTTELTR